MRKPCNCGKPKVPGTDPYIGRSVRLKDGTKGTVSSRIVSQRKTYELTTEEGTKLIFNIRELEWLYPKTGN